MRKPSPSKAYFSKAHCNESQQDHIQDSEFSVGSAFKTLRDIPLIGQRQVIPSLSDVVKTHLNQNPIVQD